MNEKGMRRSRFVLYCVLSFSSVYSPLYVPSVLLYYLCILLWHHITIHSSFKVPNWFSRISRRNTRSTSRFNPDLTLDKRTIKTR
jgi:hypothetical protein